MTHPFDDPRPYVEWPDAERFRFIIEQVQRLPGGGGSFAILRLVQEVEKLLDRVKELEGERAMKCETSQSFEVEEIDQVNEGREVWTTHSSEMVDENWACDVAFELSKKTEHGFARVVKVRREVLLTFREGTVYTGSVKT